MLIVLKAETPILVPGMVTKGTKTIAPFGVMGGRYQSAGHANFINDVLDLGLDVQQAMDQPSFAINQQLQMERELSTISLPI